MSQQGQKIAGRYVLDALAGEGGMATVWRSVMQGAAGFSRTVAIKEIKAEFGAIQSYIDMFVEEARVGSDLAHPNIVQVHDFVLERGTYYLVMEWVEGFDLAALMRAMAEDQTPMPWELVASIGLSVLNGLSAAHERRKPDGSLAPVIHRDVSPPNILLSTNGMVKLTDFGLARARDRIYSLTAPGTVKGKLSYLSPEVTYGQPVTASSDLFSLGVVMWEMLAGRRLFTGPGDLDVFSQIRRCRVPPLADIRPYVPVEMSAAVHRALMPEPAGRFPSARAMASALIEVLRASDALPDLQSYLAREIGNAYRRYRQDSDEPSTDELPRTPARRPGALKPRRSLLFSSGRLEVEFSDSEVTTRPDDSQVMERIEPAGGRGEPPVERPARAQDMAGARRRGGSLAEEVTVVADGAGAGPGPGPGSGPGPGETTAAPSETAITLDAPHPAKGEPSPG